MSMGWHLRPSLGFTLEGPSQLKDCQLLYICYPDALQSSFHFLLTQSLVLQYHVVLLNSLIKLYLFKLLHSFSLLVWSRLIQSLRLYPPACNNTAHVLINTALSAPQTSRYPVNALPAPWMNRYLMNEQINSLHREKAIHFLLRITWRPEDAFIGWTRTKTATENGKLHKRSWERV